MDKFWTMLQQSVILQGLITLLILGTYCYLLIVGREIPDVLNNNTGLIIGFFFGVKQALAVSHARSN